MMPVPQLLRALEGLSPPELHAIIAACLARLAQQTPPAPTEDRLLRAEEAARYFGKSPKWLYQHAWHLPFTVRTGARSVRFSWQGIQRYLAQQAARPNDGPA